MSNIYFDAQVSDDQRRNGLFHGDLYVYSPTPTTKEFIEFARSMIREAFGGLEPTTAQYHLPVEEYVAILKKLKPAFIHHPKSKTFLQAILRERGCDSSLTYFDVPRMRSSTSDGYLTSGIAYAFHPHRDTWYSAALCQINWWLPIFDIEADNGMAFHPKYFDVPLKNGSQDYNYQNWVATSRKSASDHIKKDTRKQPRPEEPVELNSQIRVVTPPGGMLLFSASHLHSSVPNLTGKTRFSIDFRTVHTNDLLLENGAPNLDCACTGTAIVDFLQGADLSKLPQNIIDKYMDGHPQKIQYASTSI